MRRLLFALAVLVLLAGVVVAGSKIMSAQVEGKLRSTPSPLGTPITTVKYGDTLTVVEEKDQWTKLSTTDGKVGWMANSSLTEKTIVRAGDKDAQTGVSSTEVSMAGKGFSQEVEGKYKEQHPDLTPYFQIVDKIEANRCSEADIKAFLENGGLPVAKGGGK